MMFIRSGYFFKEESEGIYTDGWILSEMHFSIWSGIWGLLRKYLTHLGWTLAQHSIAWKHTLGDMVIWRLVLISLMVSGFSRLQANHMSRRGARFLTTGS
jgi:hypothetical protein